MTSVFDNYFCHSRNGTKIEAQLLLLGYRLAYGPDIGRLNPEAEPGSAPWYIFNEEGRLPRIRLVDNTDWNISFATPELALEWALTHPGNKSALT